MTRREFLELAAAMTLVPLAACGGRTGQGGTHESVPAAGGALPQRKLGRTGVAVSLVGLGGFHMGMQETEEESLRIVRTAIDGGITFLDNCWDYNDGESERRMGKALQGGYREKVFLMSKIDGRDAATAARQIDESLQRLRTDRVDLMQIHEVIRPTDPERCFAQGGAVEALVAARQAGKIRYIGFTGHKSPRWHLEMLRQADAHRFTFDTVQMPLNVLDAHHDSFERNVLPVLVEKNIGVIGMKPLADARIVMQGIASAEECLGYAMSLPASVVVTGCDSVERVEQALRVTRGFRPLTEDGVNALLARSAPAGQDGANELYKTTEQYDGTAQNPQWLG
ncbi:aldo/keto reductase [Anaeromyxobacter terrae]|uniref:aldo/keto reductase n=1 Tax=Anaeromyxobacter terrae TaxID=2925406 RepID=UPI001F569D48|nr:aldo/keto reductase [Anaeromyxobacter sp. SG22]